jgi:hypothetical protein
MLSSGANVIIWDEMLSSGANVIIWDKMLSAVMQCYHLGQNVIIWDEMLSYGAKKKHFYTWCAGLIVHALLTVYTVQRTMFIQKKEI